MKTLRMRTALCLGVLLSLTAAAQVRPAGEAEYAYYRKGKKVALLPQPDQMFVTYANRVSRARGIAHAAQLQNQSAVEPTGVFDPWGPSATG